MTNKHTIEMMIDEKSILKKLDYLAHKINEDYGNKEISILSILSGSIVFTSDLMRLLSSNVTLNFIQLQSYTGTQATQAPQYNHILPDFKKLENKDILIVEDIIDKGNTINYLLELLSHYSFKSVNICSLLYKKNSSFLKSSIKYLGFEIDDTFVIGYGMDYSQYYRNLPFIGSLNEQP